VGLAVVGTIQGIGASSSNIVAGWLTDLGGYKLAYWVHGGVAIIAVIVFFIWRHEIAPPLPGDGKRVAEPEPAPALP
jgi:MFS family permease